MPTMLRGFRRNKEEFFASIAAGDVERAQIVLAGGEINVDCKTLEDATPFMRACYNGDLPMAKLLAKHGASVHYQSAITGETALHSACCGPSDDLFKVVEWLVTEMGVAVSVADRNGKTPLDLARMLDLPAVAKLFKEDAYDIRGKTPLDNRPPPLSPAEIEESGSYAVNGRNGYLPSELYAEVDGLPGRVTSLVIPNKTRFAMATSSLSFWGISSFLSKDDNIHDEVMAKVGVVRALLILRGAPHIAQMVEIFCGFQHPILGSSLALITQNVGTVSLQAPQFFLRLTVAERRILIRTFLETIKCMHDKGIVHRSLTVNCLKITDTSDPKSLEIDSFELSTVLPFPTSKSETRFCGGGRYTSPEMWLGKPYGVETDMFSAGVIVFFILSGDLPFNSIELHKLKSSITNLDYAMDQTTWEHVPREAQSLVRGLLETQPNRLTVDEALASPWLTPRVLDEVNLRITDPDVDDKYPFDNGKSTKRRQEEIIAAHKADAEKTNFNLSPASDSAITPAAGVSKGDNYGPESSLDRRLPEAGNVSVTKLMDNDNLHWLKVEAENLEQLLRQPSSSVGLSLQDHEIVQQLIANTCANSNEEEEKQAILRHPLHMEFYLTFNRKLFGMMSACETLATGMVSHGSVLDELRDMTVENMRKTRLGRCVAEAVVWVLTAAGSVVPVGDALGSLFKLIVFLPSDRERHVSMARAADAAALLARAQDSNLRIAVERLSRTLVRAREHKLSSTNTQPQGREAPSSDDFSSLRQRFLNLLGNQTTTTVKEEACIAADAALATLMKAESLLAKSMKARDTSLLVDAWAVDLLELDCLDDLKKFSIIAAPLGTFQKVSLSSRSNDGAAASTLDPKVPCPVQSDTNSSTVVDVSSTMSAPGQSSREDVASRKELDSLRSDVHRMEKTMRKLQTEHREIGIIGGQVYADHREQYKDNVHRNTVEIGMVQQQAATSSEEVFLLKEANRKLQERVERLEAMHGEDTPRRRTSKRQGKSREKDTVNSKAAALQPVADPSSLGSFVPATSNTSDDETLSDSSHDIRAVSESDEDEKQRAELFE